MFERSRLNWAFTKVQTSLVYDLGADHGVAKSALALVETDQVAKSIVKKKKVANWNWYLAISDVALELSKNLEDNVPGNKESEALRLVSNGACICSEGGDVNLGNSLFERQLEAVYDTESVGLTSHELYNDDVFFAESIDEIFDEETPFSTAIDYCTGEFSWSSEVHAWAQELTKDWTEEDAQSLNETLRLGIQHKPWELLPLWELGMCITKLEITEDIEELARQEANSRETDGYYFDSYNPILGMAYKSALLERVERLQELTKGLAVVERLDLTDDHIKQNQSYISHIIIEEMGKKRLREMTLSNMQDLL